MWTHSVTYNNAPGREKHALHTCTHMYIYTHTHTYSRVYTHVHKPTYTRIHTYICTYTCIYVFVYIHTHTHTHIYTYIYIYTQTRARVYTWSVERLRWHEVRKYFMETHACSKHTASRGGGEWDGEEGYAHTRIGPTRYIINGSQANRAVCTLCFPPPLRPATPPPRRSHLSDS